MKENEKDFKCVPYIVYEAMLAKEERQQRRLVIVIIVLIVLFAAFATYVFYEWNQYDYIDEVTIEAEQDGSGTNLLSGGDIAYESASESDAKTVKGA